MRRRGHPDAPTIGVDPLEGRTVDTPSVNAALDQLGSWILEQPRPSPVRPRRRLRITFPTKPRALAGALLVCASLGGAAAGANSLISADTGRYPATRAQAAMGGPGQYLRTGAPNFCQVALSVSSDLRYPNGFGAWRDYVLTGAEGFGIPSVSSTGGCSSAAQSEVSTGALHGWFAASSFCAWVVSWRRDDATGQRRAAAIARRTIASARSWPAVRREDAHPRARIRGDGDSPTSSLFGWLIPYQAGVRSGDVGRVDQLLAGASPNSDRCWIFDPGFITWLHRTHGWSLTDGQMGRAYLQFLAVERPGS